MVPRHIHGVTVFIDHTQGIKYIALIGCGREGDLIIPLGASYGITSDSSSDAAIRGIT